MKIKAVPAKHYLANMREAGVPEPAIKILKASVKKQMRELDQHMEEGGWDLDFRAIKDECLIPLVSHWFEWYLIARILKRGYKLEVKPNNEFMITKENE